ncbi:AAA family ATPase [Massilia sp.]|uniref:AAA family ATPase n=1 Tax=Massilia sp. TaxID=1882437 RepID=UPI00289A38B1|nr:AAA family ATPase [Massilia sp.]
MFSTIEIRKFRSCRDVRLSNLNEILVLIGRNGAGKTNVLKAVQWASQFASSNFDKNNIASKRLHASDGDVALTFSVGERSFCYELKRTSTYDFSITEFKVELEEKISICEGSQRTTWIHRTGEQVNLHALPSEAVTSFEIASTTSVVAAIQALFPEKSFYRAIATDIQKFMFSVKYYPLHNFEEASDNAAISGQDYKKWKATKFRELNTLSSLVLTLIHMKEEREESFNELNSLIGANGMGLIDEIQVISHKFNNPTSNLFTDSDENTYHFVRFIVHNNDEEQASFGHGISDLSFGTTRILFLLVSLLYDRATVSLVEQPEDGIHVALIDKLIPLLRSYANDAQFIVASHSTAILNRSKPEEVRLVSNADGTTQVRALSSEELAAAAGYLEEDGPLSDFLISLGDD